jgi:glutaredoxin 3
MVREFLSQKGINFEERDVSRNPLYAQELMTTTGQMGVPVTVIDGQVVIGFDHGRLQQLINTMQTKQHLSFGASIADASKITAQQSSGLTSGDIITELNMKTIANAKDLEDAISALNGGSRLSLIFIRDDRTISTEGTF